METDVQITGEQGTSRRLTPPSIAVDDNQLHRFLQSPVNERDDVFAGVFGGEVLGHANDDAAGSLDVENRGFAEIFGGICHAIEMTLILQMRHDGFDDGNVQIAETKEDLPIHDSDHFAHLAQSAAQLQRQLTTVFAMRWHFRLDHRQRDRVETAVALQQRNL